MKVIKQGTPYRKHKCLKCRSVYAYHINKDKGRFAEIMYCPVCDNYLDLHLFDRRISVEKYNNLKDLGGKE